MNHDLKILPVYFSAVFSGDKNFEIRNNNDRGFNKGDLVTLSEFVDGRYTGQELKREITYVTNYEQKPGYVVFGMKKL